MKAPKLRALADVCLPTVESIDPRRSPQVEFWYVDISAVDNASKRIVSPQKVLGALASVRARQVVQTNDVIVATTRPNLNAVALIPEKYSGEVCSTGFCVLRANTELDPEFLFYFVQSQAFIESLVDLTKGALYPAVTDKQVLAQKIPWIPVDTQRQIAAQLKNQLVEVEKARQAAALQLLEAAILKSKVLESVLGDIRNCAPLGSCSRVQSGFAFKSDTFKSAGVRLLRNANILPGKVYWDESVFLSDEDTTKYPDYVLNCGDVLISLDRPIISSGIKVARVGTDDLPALLVQRVGRFLLEKEKIDADYLYAFLQTDMFISAISGHDQSLGVPYISPTQVENVEIPLPPMSMQKTLSKKLIEMSRSWEIAFTAAHAQLQEIAILPQKILAQVFET